MVRIEVLGDGQVIFVWFVQPIELFLLHRADEEEDLKDNSQWSEVPEVLSSTNIVPWVLEKRLDITGAVENMNNKPTVYGKPKDSVPLRGKVIEKNLNACGLGIRLKPFVLAKQEGLDKKPNRNIYIGAFPSGQYLPHRVKNLCDSILEHYPEKPRKDETVQNKTEEKKIGDEPPKGSKEEPLEALVRQYSENDVNCLTSHIPRQRIREVGRITPEADQAWITEPDSLSEQVKSLTWDRLALSYTGTIVGYGLAGAFIAGGNYVAVGIATTVGAVICAAHYYVIKHHSQATQRTSP